MKFIKKFESLFSNEDKRDCKIILNHEKVRFKLSNKVENISNHELNEIKRMFSFIDNVDIVYGNKIINIILYFTKQLKINASIKKYEDGYFIAEVNCQVWRSRNNCWDEEDESYACDQIYGLETFSKVLKDLIRRELAATHMPF